MNWPNGLTLARLLLGPIVLVCLLVGAVRAAFYLFVIAMMTDLYDGYLARRSNSVTEFGKLMDPLADKVLVSLVLVGFILLKLPYVRLWMVAAIVGRELLILGCRTGVLKSGEGFVTSKAAKWKTAAQMSWIASILLYLSFSPEASRSGFSLNGPVETILWAFGVVAVALTLISGAEYVLGRRAPEGIGTGAPDSGTGKGS